MSSPLLGVVNTLRRRMIILFIFWVGAFHCRAADFPKDAASFDVFLLIGQSNMKGRGALSEKSATDPRVWMFPFGGNQWVPARDPLHAAGQNDMIDRSDNAGVGPGMSFARALLAENPQAVIGLVPAAVGGARIDQWLPEPTTGPGNGTTKRFYDEALRRARLALAVPVEPKPILRGILWLQGESDSTADRHNLYQEKLLRLVDALREEFGDPQLPFIACTIGAFIPRDLTIASMTFAHTREINDILLELPALRDRTATVDARDLTGHIGDRLHYDTASQEIIGEQFAAKYLELVLTDVATGATVPGD
jgi:hypothetical protein